MNEKQALMRLARHNFDNRLVGFRALVKVGCDETASMKAIRAFNTTHIDGRPCIITSAVETAKEGVIEISGAFTREYNFEWSA